MEVVAVTPRRDQCLLLERLTHQDSLHGLLSLCHQGLDFFSFSTAPFPPSGHQAPGADRENSLCLPTPSLKLSNEAFPGAWRQMWGGGMCMSPCLRRNKEEGKEKAEPPPEARKEPHSSHNSWSEWFLFTKHIKARPRLTWRCFRRF